MYSIFLSKRFDRDFSALDKKTQEKIVEKLKEMRRDPHVGKPLKGRLKGLYSFRVGDYRIIYQIFDGRKTVIGVSVGHRKKVYNRM